jgi:hypothetical protein
MSSSPLAFLPSLRLRVKGPWLRKLDMSTRADPTSVSLPCNIPQGPRSTKRASFRQGTVNDVGLR